MNKVRITLNLTDWEASQIMWALEFVGEYQAEHFPEDDDIGPTCRRIHEALHGQIMFGEGDQVAAFESPMLAVDPG